MGHDKELIIFLRIDSVTVNRSKPPLPGINETFVTCAHGSELHVDLSGILRLLCSCTQLLLSAELSFGILLTPACSHSPSCQGRCNSCGSSVCSPCFCPQLLYSAQPQHSQGLPGGLSSWRDVENGTVRVGLCGKRSRRSTEAPGAGQTLFWVLHLCGLSSEWREYTALRYEIPFSPQKV